MNVVRTARSYWIVCLIFLPFIIFAAFSKPWAQTADMWETAAAMRAAAQNVFHPANPLLPLPGYTSPRFTPYVLFWGALSRVTGWGLFTVVGLAGVVNYILFVTGLAHWITAEFKQPRLVLFLFVTMIVVWGTGYSYANAYQLRLFLASLAYVGAFTYGLCFHALGFLRKYMDSSSWSPLLAYTLLSILAFVTHPLTALFLYVAAVAMLLSENRWKRTILLQLVPLISFGVSLFWPYFDYWTVLTKGSSESWYPGALFHGWAPALGTALAGIPIVVYYGIHRRYPFAVWGTAFCVNIYWISGAFKFLTGSRFVLYGAIFLHLCIALYLFENWPEWWKNARFRHRGSLWKPAIVILLFLPALRFRAGEAYHFGKDMAHAAFGTPHEETAAERFSSLSTALGDSDVVMAEDDTGWPIPALTGARLVCQQKGDPLIQPEIEKRRADATAFFQSQMSTDDRRALLKNYHVTRIVLDITCKPRWDPFLFQQIVQFAHEERSQQGLIVFRVNPL